MKKIFVIPLQENFLQVVAGEVARYYLDDDPLSLAGVTVCLPHRRGILYLRAYLFDLIGRGKGFIPPRLIAIDDLLREVAMGMEDPPRRPLSPPDQAWLLFQVVKGVAGFGAIAASWDRFFPWGIRLASIIEEIDREMAKPVGIPYPEDIPEEVAPLLEGLGVIYSGFVKLLEEGGYTTSGKRMRLVAEGVEGTDLGKGITFLAGFYALTRAEERIFRHLFSCGAKVFWHADPDHLPPLYRRWQEEWGVDIEVMGEKRGDKPQIHYYEAADLHAELVQARSIIPSGIERPDQCCIVLPDPSPLIPLLYTIPGGVPANISLGYPLERTPLASLIDGIMRLQEGKNEQGGYYHGDYLTLIRHPYLRRLKAPGGGQGRICLHFLEEKIRGYGKPFLTEEEIRGVLFISEDKERDRRFLAAEGIGLDEVEGFVGEINRYLIGAWEGLQTPKGLAAVLKGLVRFLFAPITGNSAYPLDPLENEFIYTLESGVIPALEDALFGDSPMDKGLLFALLREMIHMARTPFEGEPLVGLQVLGLLETRLLSFERVIVIDANEDILPPHEEINPLLPEPLKGVLGLEGRERQEEIIRYHFERLIKGSKEVHLFWQGGAGVEGKRTRSRFIEGLLWEEEKEKQRILDDRVVKAPLRIPASSLLKEIGLAKGPRERQKVEGFLEMRRQGQGLSATLLETYLTCPLRFYYQYLLGLRPLEGVSEEVDHASLGEVIHRALQLYFTPYLRRAYRRVDADPEGLIALFTRELHATQMYRALAPHRRFLLERVAIHRLRSYLSHAPDATFIEGLEREYRRWVELPLGRFLFYGKVDRIDSREGYRIVLDYKTGRVAALPKGNLERHLLGLHIPAGFGKEGLEGIKKVIKDLQLPLYILLVTGRKRDELERTLAAYVRLGGEGDESYFIPKETLAARKDDVVGWFTETLPALLSYLISHMLEATHFYPATDADACRYCDYEKICRFSYAV